MNDLLPLAETIAARLKARSETIAVAESSTGGLISAALLAVPGASAYFLGGAIVYTRQAKSLLLAIGDGAQWNEPPISQALAPLRDQRFFPYPAEASTAGRYLRPSVNRRQGSRPREPASRASGLVHKFGPYGLSRIC